MARIEPSKFQGLIDRLRALSARTAPHAVFDIVKPDFAAVRALAESGVTTGDKQDTHWLARRELRSTKQVASMLEGNGFAARPGQSEAIFVDARCGLIASEALGSIADADRDMLVGRILRAASNARAHGIILATNGLDAPPQRKREWRQITAKLHDKGEAIDLFLLDHVVLTRRGWSGCRWLRGLHRAMPRPPLGGASHERNAGQDGL